MWGRKKKYYLWGAKIIAPEGIKYYLHYDGHDMLHNADGRLKSIKKIKLIKL